MKLLVLVLFLTTFLTSSFADQSECVVENYDSPLSAATHYVLRNDHVAALSCYRAVAQDEPLAAYNLGVMFTVGYGTDPNDEEAVKWFTKAANAGLERAQYNLGVRFFLGDGVEKDYEKAYKWFYAADNIGYEPATSALKAVSFRLSPEEVNRAKHSSQMLLNSLETVPMSEVLEVGGN